MRSGARVYREEVQALLLMSVFDPKRTLRPSMPGHEKREPERNGGERTDRD